MSHVSIKTKIVVLSNLLFLFLVTAIIIFLYFTFSITLYKQEEKILIDEADHAAEHISIALTKNEKIYELHDLITKNTNLSIYYNDGKIVSADMESGIINLKFNNEQIRKIKLNDKTFLVYDKIIYDKETILAQIRVSRTLSYVDSSLTNIKIALVLSTPLFFAIFIIIISLLVNKILMPIDKLTKTANNFSEKDLSKRLDLPETDDEIGRLTKTFNKMLSKIETSFHRERQFTSDASHELRTPLSVIRVNAEEALKNNRDIKFYKKTIRNVLKENKKMDYLISQLLFLAWSDENVNNLNIETIDLKVITEDIINSFKNILKRRNIKFFFEFEDNLKIKADQLLITSLLINLIGNAIKFNKNNGFVKIKITKDNYHAKISIEDSGIGIPEKDLPLIFNRFYKTDHTRNSEGSGVGLSIVKWIIDAHVGSIEVNSVPGEGTLFKIKLPISNTISTS
ncbi:MAG: HAMP domain-containing histidine kinase [Actinobacteria bacterium]|nr:HAMP domain-containing histidine kinase [Actinomycetota bacterium]